MPDSYDCIVLGLGGFGSGAACHLARRGLRVLGLEQFPLNHARGSSHGETRIIRKAYFEHPDYVPLLHRAYELWEELEDHSGNELLNLTGLLLAGPESGDAISGTRKAIAQHALNIATISHEDAGREFSGFRFPENSSILFEPEAGILLVEQCVETHLQLAQQSGAVLHSEERVLSWSANQTGVEVETDRNRYSAGSLVISAGAWLGSLLAELKLPLTVQRKSMFWFPVNSDVYAVSKGTSVFYFDFLESSFYGIPELNQQRLKVAQHLCRVVELVEDPATLNRELNQQELVCIQDFLKQCLPEVSPNPVQHSVCMYTMTADGHFLVDTHPEHSQVVIAGGFSGHGFKFTSVMGEVLADLVEHGRTAHPIDFLSLNRFLNPSD